MATRLYKLSIILSLVLFVAGCKPDPAVLPSNLTNPLLTGKWVLKSLDVETQVDADPPTTVNFTTFTKDDFFEFKANNAATYSSSLVGSSYQGYYSTDNNITPAPIHFTSGDFIATFYIQAVTADTLIIYQTASNTFGKITTTVTNIYTYKR